MLPLLHAPPHHRSTRAHSKLVKRRLRAATGAMALLASALAFYWLLLRSPALGLPPATRSYDQQHVIRSNDQTEQQSSPVFRPGTVWVDQAGVPLQAHGGGMLLHKGVYYWYGEDKSKPTYMPQPVEGRYTAQRVDVVGVRCYSSTDLSKWQDEGLVLRAGQHPDLDASRVLERPKVVYNERTKRFIMWMHIDDVHYAEARAGVAWSDSPTGPFHYVRSERPNGQMSRDMTLFQDDDGRAWLLCASENNQVLHINELAPDYLSFLPGFTRALEGRAREAPAVFKHGGRYFLLTSGCTGWAPNPAEVFTAAAMEGPWRSLGNPCRDSDPAACATFFRSQDTYVLPVPGQAGQGHFIMMADRWNPDDLGNSRYIWLPLWVHMQPSGQPGEADGEAAASVVVRWFDAWGWSVFDEWASDEALAQA